MTTAPRRRSRRAAAAVSVALVSLASACGGAADAGSPPAPGDPTATPGTILGTTPCPAADGSSPRVVEFGEPPPMCIDTTARYEAVFETSAGELRATLEPSGAPRAVNNFVVLARYHFYDGTPIDRVYPGEAIGGGAQPPPGRQDPGYRFADELPAEGAAAYGRATLMLDTQGPDTNGSRFLILTGDAGVAPKFTILGSVTAGLDTVVPAAVARVDADGEVTDPLTLERVTIVER